MDKESIYELQKIDCNCSDCGLMTRNVSKNLAIKEAEKQEQIKEFTKQKQKAIDEAFDVIDNAGNIQDERSGRGMLRVAEKMYFQYQGSPFLVQYGHCSFHEKEVNFIPGICQPHTQKCFKHRKELKTN